ncbi:hypothetical protein [Halostreptopolyspora alba]|uniref:Uncharacterized protein n=1 Tax=Halostreptopolyspora alba TaxID=2487137 RepID=A0A3N0E6L5_9ACTN|nr:hypothetical protein EFW17_16010 [Nocardiopsaceae bacterium YIM 96095]
MKYAGVVVGAIAVLLGLGLLVIVGGSVLAQSGTYPTDVDEGFGTMLAVEAYMGLSRVVGGFIAGLMARGTRSAPWVIGAGAAAALLAAVVGVLIGISANSAESGPAATAGDLVVFVLWPLEGALGGWLAWLIPRRSK